MNNEDLEGQNNQLRQIDDTELNRNWKKATIVLTCILTVILGYYFFNPQPEDIASENIIRRDLAEFVMNVKSVSNDPIVVRRNVENAYAYVTRKGAMQLDKVYKSINLSDKLGCNATITVLIKSITKNHESLYVVCWTETEFQNSKTLTAMNFTGFFRIVFISAKMDKEYFAINPAGIFINNITIKKNSSQ